MFTVLKYNTLALNSLAHARVRGNQVSNPCRQRIYCDLVLCNIEDKKPALQPAFRFIKNDVIVS